MSDVRSSKVTSKTPDLYVNERGQALVEFILGLAAILLLTSATLGVIGVGRKELSKHRLLKWENDYGRRKETDRSVEEQALGDACRWSRFFAGRGHRHHCR